MGSNKCIKVVGEDEEWDRKIKNEMKKAGNIHISKSL